MMKIYEVKVFIVMLSAIFTLALVWFMSFDMCDITDFCRNDTYNNKKNIYIQRDDGTQIPIEVEVADSQSEIQKGLMYRQTMNENSGMIFVMPYENDWGFWMKNTKIPLDMIFVNKDYKIVYVKENAQPCVTDYCESYNSSQSVVYIIEVNAGWTKKNKIEIGERVIFDI